MHTETLMIEQGDDTQSQADYARPGVSAGFFGSIMDVLMPATPPTPKNARIVRQFDLEAAKTDARPVAEPVATARRSKHERPNREEARALRNRSLAAAAGLD